MILIEGFHKGGPYNAGQQFEYWGAMDNLYRNAYDDQNAYYTNGSFTPESDGATRYNEIAAGQNLISMLESGDITLGNDELIKIVSHSQGAAYAAGIASVVAKNDKYGLCLAFVDYIAPHQPGEFVHPDNVMGRQFSTKCDLVSSKGKVAQMFGASTYMQIMGARWAIERDSHPSGMGGHYVDTWLKDIANYFRSQGVTVWEEE